MPSTARIIVTRSPTGNKANRSKNRRLVHDKRWTHFDLRDNPARTASHRIELKRVERFARLNTLFRHPVQTLSA
jgi:hypothetical protein